MSPFHQQSLSIFHDFSDEDAGVVPFLKGTSSHVMRLTRSPTLSGHIEKPTDFRIRFLVVLPMGLFMGLLMGSLYIDDSR